MKTAIFIIVAMLLCVLVFKKCKKEITSTRCSVVSHSITEDRGDIHYHTVVDCDNGQVIDETDIGYYSIPVGAHTIHEYVNFVIDTTKQP